MDYIKDPMAIEIRSFEIIKPYIEKLNLYDISISKQFLI